MGEKLVPLVERGELRLAHDGPLLTQAQPAGVGAGVVGGQPGQDLPLQAVFSTFILELPDMTSQAGFDALRTVSEIRFVVAITDFPRPPCDARVGLVRLALLHHGGLVHHGAVLAPGIVHGALGCPPTAVAIAVERPLHRKVVAVGCHHLCIVPRYDF